MGKAFGLAALVSFSLILGATAAVAQSVQPDEGLSANGAVRQDFALTAAQKRAIYDVVLQQRVRPPAERLNAAVGAPVPPAIELLDLPDQAAASNPAAGLLKYAMVQGDIVLIDPVSMRVVDVIRDGYRP